MYTCWLQYYRWSLDRGHTYTGLSIRPCVYVTKEESHGNQVEGRRIKQEGAGFLPEQSGVSVCSIM